MSSIATRWASTSLPPGLAEVVVLGAGGAIAPADAARNRARALTVDCDHGPVVAVAGRFVHTSIRTTVGALLDGEPVAALPCEREPIALPAGQQELLISPGAAFVVDGAQLSTPGAGLSSATVTSAETGAWGPTHREVRVPESATSRVLVVPESINSGWVARTSTGARLTPIAVNGWQQAWVVPAGNPGTITLTFAPNSLYRASLAIGLALLPLLALLAFWRTGRRQLADRPTPPWRPGAWAAAGVLAAGAVIASIAGVMVMGTALGVRYALRRRERLRDRVTVGLAAGGLILAGAALSRHPWRSVDGYAGNWASVQLLALISVSVVAASVVATSESRGQDRMQ